MQEEIAELVYPIFNAGIRLKERLDDGEDLDLEKEQAHLKGLLLTDTESRRWGDFGGDVDPESQTNGHADRFYGIRYALVCWLDELFILDSPWASAWTEYKLEAALYGTNDRAWRFWEQAKKAERRTSRDALEVFFLCVMLGFRGEYSEDLTQLDNWISAARAHISRGLAQNWPYPPELEPPINVPPRHGREQLENMVIRGGVLLLLLVPFLVAFLIQQLGQ